MKNLNLLNFKSAVRRKARWLITLIVILTLGVGQMWGDISYSGGYIYFDNSLGINSNTLQLCARQSSWTGVSSLSNISNTKLYYVANPQGSGWGGILGWVVISANPAKSNSNFDDWSSYTWCSDWNTYGFNSGSTYLIVPSSTSKSQSVTTSYYSAGYSALNSTQTINTVVKTGSGSYTAANSKATISITSYEMTGNGAVTKRTPSLGTSVKTQTVSAARTATTTLSVGTVATGYQFDGWWTAATGGTQLSSSTSYTYYPTAATTVYARFSEKMSTVTLTASPSAKGTFTVGSTPNQTSTTAGVTTTRSVTAVPISGYHFVSWSITGGASISSTTTNPTTVTGGGAGTAATLTATFEADAVNSLTVSKGTGISTVTGSTSPVTLGSKYAISATPATGYAFSGWTASPAANGTFDNASNASTNVTVKNGSVVVTASGTERMSTLSTSCHYDAGNPSYAAPSVSGSATNVGYVTTRTITATAAGTGYTFAGWTLTNCTRTDGGAATATSITIRSNGDGAAATVVANYNEDLSSSWTLKGGTNVTGDSWATAHNFTKKTGHSTESVAYCTFNVSSTNSGIDGDASDWSFKLINGSTWYGLTADGDSWWYQRNSGQQTLSTSGKNIQLCADVAGPYEIKVDYTTPASPKVTVTFPTSYTLTYSIGTVKGTSGSISTSPSTTSGSKVLSGTNITLTAPAAKSGYTWKGWYTNAAGTTGKIDDVSRAITVTMNADKTLYACYTENNYTVTVAAGAGGSVASTSVTGHKDTKVTLPTATPNVGYVFTGWTVTSGTATLTDASSASAAQINGMTADVTVTANFAAATAYIEGRFHVTNASRNGTWTNTFSDGDWDENSTRIKFTWDGTNSRFYLHTYATPKELTTQISSFDPVFYIKTSSSSSSLANVVSYWSATSQTLSAAGTGNKRTLAHTGTLYNDRLKFNSSTTSGYAVIYFDEAGIWYELEQRLQYNGNGSTSGSAPTGATGNNTYYATGTNATAASNTYTKTNYTFGGWNTNQYITGTNYAAGATNVVMSTDITLYAKWTRSITLNANGGGSGSTSVTATYNCATLPSITNPSKTGYTFGGWNTANDGSGDIVINTSGEFLPITGWCDSGKRFTRTESSATLYAKWTQTVTLNANTANHGSGTDKTATVILNATALSEITHCTPATGYHRVGYYTAAADGVKVLNADGSFASSAVTDYITGGKWTKAGATTLYAHYEPNTYDVTLKANTGSGSDQVVEATYDAAMPTTLKGGGAITVHTKTGYNLLGYWDATSDGNQYYSYNVGTSTLSSYRTWNKTSATDLYAHWTPKTTAITLDQTGAATTGSVTTRTGTYGAAMPAITGSGSLPTAPQGYAFMGYFDDEDGEGTQYYNANGTSARTWNKEDAAVTLYAYFKKAEITALTLDAASVETGGEVGVTPTIAPTPEPTVSVCWRVLYENDNPLDPQPEISWNGTKATFTAPLASGTYKVEAKLHTGSSCGGGTLLDTRVASFTVAGVHTVTINYKCGDDVIKAPTTTTGRPFDWSGDITAPDIFGYTFSGWTAGDGITIKDGESSTATTHIKATYNGTLTANYTQKSIIYFKNTLGWSDVYVNFYAGAKWNNPKGSGNQSVTNRNKHMTRIGDSDVWYYDYGAASISPSLYVSFTSVSQDNSEYFWANPVVNVVYPANYPDAINTDKSSENGFKAATPMFVPLATQDGVTLNSSGGGKANYYNAGYWTKYTVGTGYVLEIYNAAGDSWIKNAEFTSGDDLMPMTAIVDLEGNHTYKYILRRGGTGDAGINYGNTGTMTYADHGQTGAWDMTNTMGGGFQKAGITTTAAGNYTFHLSYGGHPLAEAQYRLRMAVDYPVATGDYRVIYKDNVHTGFKPSAIVQKVNNSKDTVSFFIRPGQTPVMKIQQATVNGSTGAITWSSGTDVSSSLSALSKDSVYNICLTMNESGAISVENVAVYTGNFYIRTDAANSKWDNYRSDPDHRMTYSEYSITHGGYSHYYCHWVQADDSRKNVKFVIANDYSPCISDTLIREPASGTWANIEHHIDEYGNILRNANVRFMWNQHDNTVSRAYVDGAQGVGSNIFLYILSEDGKIKKSSGSALDDHKVQFSDNGNWIYEANIKAQPNAQIKLLSNWSDSYTITQYFKGSSSKTETLIGGSGDTWYDIRVIYDYKTNRLVSAWIPSGEIGAETNINADVMFIREHQGDIAQLTFTGDGAIKKIETAYGVLRFNKWTINNKSKAAGHAALSPELSRYERDLFYVSFPFRVSMEEVFGFGTYGTHWIIEYYDGAGRAANGYWAESGPNWKFITNRKGKFFEPYEGYIIALDLDELGESSDVWANTEQVELYFPSYGEMPNITNSSYTHEIPAHLCSINWCEQYGLSDPNYDRRVKDSHWNVLSVPTYVNINNVSFANTDWITSADATHVGPNFLYEWNPSDNSVTARSGVGYNYHAMHAYLVQYYGNVTWTTSVSPALAPRRNPEYRGEYEFRMEMLQNDVAVDQTYVKLSDDEAVTTGFEFNYDLSKEFNNSKSNIYTLIGTEQVAGNVLPLTEQTTIVPVGVDVKTDGNYTFAIPDGTSGIGVILIDNETGIHLNLGALDYKVFLEAGTYNERFVLEISPIKQALTDIELINGENGDASPNGVRKVLIDQKMYIIKGDKMFDATGRRVE